MSAGGTTDRLFRLSLLLGVLFRLVLLPFTMVDFDVSVLKFAGRAYYEHGKLSLFSNWTRTPLLYYIVLFFYSFYYLLHYKLGVPDFYPFLHATGALETFFLKLPFLIADVFTFIILYKSASLLGMKGKKRLATANLFFLNPYIMLVSSVYGMGDTLASFFIVLGIYVLIRSSRHEGSKPIYVATLLFLMSFGVKWIGFAPLFILFTVLVARKQYRKVAGVIGLSAMFFALLYLPFLIHGWEYLLHVLGFRLYSAGSTPHSLSYLELLMVLGVPGKFLSYLFLPLYLGFVCLLFATIMYLYRKGKVLEGTILSPKEITLFVTASALMFTMFYILYHSVNQFLFVWFITLTPLLLGTQMGKEAKDWVKLLIMGFSLGMGVFGIALAGPALFFGYHHPGPGEATGLVALVYGISTLFITLNFITISYFLSRTLFRMLHGERGGVQDPPTPRRRTR